ncbi:MauE/DoxX family redox-associated membrane protein [Algoriphagus sp. NG3]|uniref:MauE/DoxX family redox-associated membrane protein n=1 Tax=Algoriphagus sp. NG3 TaxID=3097546 RepID=UPI002A80DB5A|nr:MauE/DoxX family redox-associated membrane protein [Algoriphagus sp. NG3]WPR76275.1 DoxX-like family protein [Algoriphagus sp. NG3]
MKSPAISPTTVLAEGAAWLLAAVFAYTAVSKVYDWSGTLRAVKGQVFQDWMTVPLLYGLPILEISLAVMLLLPKTRRAALGISFILMAVFTGYVALVLTGIFGRIPCSCGGILSSLDWNEHLIVNLVLTAIAAIGWIVQSHLTKLKQPNPL